MYMVCKSAQAGEVAPYRILGGWVLCGDFFARSNGVASNQSCSNRSCSKPPIHVDSAVMRLQRRVARLTKKKGSKDIDLLPIDEIRIMFQGGNKYESSRENEFPHQEALLVFPGHEEVTKNFSSKDTLGNIVLSVVMPCLNEELYLGYLHREDSANF